MIIQLVQYMTEPLLVALDFWTLPYPQKVPLIITQIDVTQNKSP